MLKRVFENEILEFAQTHEKMRDENERKKVRKNDKYLK